MFFKAFTNSKNLTKAIDAIEECPANSITEESIKYVQEVAFSPKKGGRKHVRSIAVLISDRNVNNLATVQKKVLLVSTTQKFYIEISNMRNISNMR